MTIPFPENDLVLTPPEEYLGGVIQERGEQARTEEAVALALGAAFVFYRRVMTRKLREEAMKTEPTPAELIRMTAKIFDIFVPHFVSITVPALISGYMLGMKEAKMSAVDAVFLAETANAYAEALGKHINEVSADALVQGYQTQLNRRIARRAALERVIDAYGVTPRTMKTLANIWVTPPDATKPVLTSQPVKNPVHDRIDHLIASSLERRAKTIGITESVSAKNQAKQILWLFAQQNGDLPRTLTKQWVTADDERVCPTCGPLHLTDVPIDQEFVLPGGIKVWGPALHANCRCDMRLKAPSLRDTFTMDVDTREPEMVNKSVWGVLSKAIAGDPYDRDRRGRFAASEARQRTVFRPVQTSQPQPRVVNQRQVNQRQVNQRQVVQRQVVQNPPAEQRVVSTERQAQPARTVMDRKREVHAQRRVSLQRQINNQMRKVVQSQREELTPPPQSAHNAPAWMRLDEPMYFMREPDDYQHPTFDELGSLVRFGRRDKMLNSSQLDIQLSSYWADQASETYDDVVQENDYIKMGHYKVPISTEGLDAEESIESDDNYADAYDTLQANQHSVYAAIAAYYRGQEEDLTLSDFEGNIYVVTSDDLVSQLKSPRLSRSFIDSITPEVAVIEHGLPGEATRYGSGRSEIAFNPGTFTVIATEQERSGRESTHPMAKWRYVTPYSDEEDLDYDLMNRLENPEDD